MKRLLFALLCVFLFACEGARESGFVKEWPENADRIWIGPDYWANRLQDWKVENGKLVCVASAPNRNVHRLTYVLGDEIGNLHMSVRFSILNSTPAEADSSWVGVMLGAKGQFKDYRDDAIYGKGLNIGVTASGWLFVGNPVQASGEKADLSGAEVEMRVDVEPSGGDTYKIDVALFTVNGEKPLANLRVEGLVKEQVEGNMALVSHFVKEEEPLTTVSAAFSNWEANGTKLLATEDHAFGPILFAQHTLSRGKLKMTAQMAPTGMEDDQEVGLELKREGVWKQFMKAKIEPVSRTALFEVEDWQINEDVAYRLAYSFVDGSGTKQAYYFEGVVRKDPINKDSVVVAAFTGNNDIGFPNQDLVSYVEYHDPDMLFFSGDQIYERVGGYGVQRGPTDQAILDYLRKWYLYGWAYADLMRDRPTVAIPDDHDVFHGNIWGENGKKAAEEGSQKERQDSGGYTMPAEFVNMVQRTQTSHLPDPYDPSPVDQGIGVYYTDLVYGGISFAVLEDRKFKTAPAPFIPEAKVDNGWIQNRSFDPKTQADVPGAKLLGDRQLNFLENWSADWSGGVWMKAVLSQTIFANVATLPKDEYHDAIVPRLRILPKGEYAEDDRPVSDMDSNGWPQTGRNKALRAMRKAFAVHIAGDQHLGSTIQYGVDEWGDAPYAICVPSISNLWPRRWYPSEEGKNREEGAPKYTGDFEDGFGNKMTVHAVSNPYFTGKKPSALYDRAAGYGIVTFYQDSREIKLANWPREVDPAQAGAEPYEGWPVLIKQSDNYARQAYGYLPTIKVEGIENPVIQVIDDEKDEVLYTLRINGMSYRPPVFKEGEYTIRVGEPGTDQMRTLPGITPGGESSLLVSF